MSVLKLRANCVPWLKWPGGNVGQFIYKILSPAEHFHYINTFWYCMHSYTGQMYAYYIVLEFKLLLEPTQNCSDYLVSCLYNNKICSHVIARSIAVIECYIANMLSSL